MDLPITIIWVSPLSFLGVLEVIFNCLSQFSMKLFLANRIAPDGAPRSAALYENVQQYYNNILAVK